ncbi:unnamed protein product [Lampetra planeri]
MSYGAVREYDSQFHAQRQAMSEANQTKFRDTSHDANNCLKKMSDKMIKDLVTEVLSLLCALTALGGHYSEDQLMRLNRMRDEFLQMVQDYEQTQQDEEDEDETDAHGVRSHVTRQEQEERKKRRMANEAIQQQTIVAGVLEIQPYLLYLQEVMIDINEIKTRLNQAFSEMNRAIELERWYSCERAVLRTLMPEFESWPTMAEPGISGPSIITDERGGVGGWVPSSAHALHRLFLLVLQHIRGILSAPLKKRNSFRRRAPATRSLRSSHRRCQFQWLPRGEFVTKACCQDVMLARGTADTGTGGGKT